MRARTWLITVVGLIALGAGTAIGVNAAIDIYGLFRNARGRRLPAYGDGRVAKYLLNSRYVGENFNSILIGSSLSTNWDVKGIKELRVYNESIDGANAVEESAIVELLLRHSAISVAFVVVHPYLTSSQEFPALKLEPSLWWCALGSHNLVEAYKAKWKAAVRPPDHFIDEAGTETIGKLPSQLNADLRRLLEPSTPFTVRPLAMAVYRDMAKELRLRHARIVYIVPPIREDLLRAKSRAFEEYTRLATADRGADDLMIDFTAPGFAAFREDRANFADGVHLEPHAAKTIVAEIDSHVGRWIAHGLLPRPAPREDSDGRR